MAGPTLFDVTCVPEVFSSFVVLVLLMSLSYRSLSMMVVLRYAWFLSIVSCEYLLQLSILFCVLRLDFR